MPMGMFRVSQIANSRFPDYFSDPTNLRKTLSNILVCTIQSTEELLDVFDHLESEIQKHNVKFLVLDSVASLMRKEYRGGSLERTDILSRQASTLKSLSTSFHIPVLVTNQVTTRFNVPLGFEKSHKEELPNNFVIAALGNTWFHAVNTRLIVEYTSEEGLIVSSDFWLTPAHPLSSLSQEQERLR